MESMARKLRIQYAGALYHVINRVNYRRMCSRPLVRRNRFWSAWGKHVRRPVGGCMAILSWETTTTWRWGAKKGGKP